MKETSGKLVHSARQVFSSQNVPCLAQRDGFGSSALIPWPCPGQTFSCFHVKKYSDRTTNRERRESYCKSDESEKWVAGMFPKASRTLKKCVTAVANYFEENVLKMDLRLLIFA